MKLTYSWFFRNPAITTWDVWRNSANNERELSIFHLGCNLCHLEDHPKYPDILSQWNFRIPEPEPTMKSHMEPPCMVCFSYRFSSKFKPKVCKWFHTWICLGMVRISGFELHRCNRSYCSFQWIFQLLREGMHRPPSHQALLAFLHSSGGNSGQSLEANRRFPYIATLLGTNMSPFKGIFWVDDIDDVPWNPRWVPWRKSCF